VTVQTFATLSEGERKLALERFRLLEPHLQDGRELRSVSEGSGVTFRTLQRWVASYKRQGLAGLVRKERADVGARRTTSPRLREAIEGLALEKPPLPLSSVHRQAKQFAQMIGEHAPSYWIVRDIVHHLPSDLRTLAQQGPRRFGELYELVHRREASKPNALWQADHTQLDIVLLREDGTSCRPWLTAVIDDYSRSIAGYFLGFDPPSSLRTSLAMRQAIWRKADAHWQVCGIPDVLYVDNGTDFVSKHLEQVAVDLKMRLVFSTPGKPQGRGKIERFFRTVNEMFLCDLEGYTRRGRRKPTMTIDQLEQQFRVFLVEVYQRTPVAESELSPSAKWEEGGFLPRIPVSLEQLDLLLIEEIRPRKVRRDGIHFQGFRYISLTLAAYVGEDVTVRFDPRDMAEIRVFFKDRFLCRAISAEIAGETVALRDIVRVRNSRRRELKSILDSRQKTVDVLLQLKKGQSIERTRISEPAPTAPATRIKRYRGVPSENGR
jgi:putative transposase